MDEVELDESSDFHRNTKKTSSCPIRFRNRKKLKDRSHSNSLCYTEEHTTHISPGVTIADFETQFREHSYVIETTWAT